MYVCARGQLYTCIDRIVLTCTLYISLHGALYVVRMSYENAGLNILKMQDKLDSIAPGGSFKGQNDKRLTIAGRGNDFEQLALSMGMAAISLPSASPKGKAAAFPSRLPRMPQLDEVIDEFYKERGGRLEPM